MDGMVLILLAVILVGMATLFVARKSTSGNESASSQAAASRPGASTTTQQMVQDIRITKTSRVVDEVAIVDELSQHTPGFRQYCELVGTSGSDTDLIAPYSKRKVAYYDIRCFRVERIGGQTVETLVAHERSIEPFYFTDASTDEKVYVDLETFDSDVILVNSTNHIEGPGSDFAKAVGTGSSATYGSGSSAAMAMVAHGAERLGNVLARVRDVFAPRPRPALAFAGATPGGVGTAIGGFGRASSTLGSNMTFAMMRPSGPGNAPRPSVSGKPRPGGAPRPSGAGQARPGASPRPTGPSGSGPHRTDSHRPPANMGGTMGMPPGLDVFFGSSRPSMPYSRPRRNTNEELAGALLGMTLSAALNSIGNTSAQNATQNQSSFQGYRLVEDVVPLGGPVYCIGEIYRSGTQVRMGRSLADDYPTSFFACKSEAEVISSLSAR